MGISSFAQDNSEIIPPSPSLQNLQRYEDYPVEFYTGLVNGSIPHWEIKAGELSSPISISSHNSGRLANDVGGSLGIGWSLIAGGLYQEQ